MRVLLLSSIAGAITQERVMLSAVIALVITFAIVNISRMIKDIMHYPARHSFMPKDINIVIERCNALFPKETVMFRGKSFTRGMKIRVTTTSNKSFEGELIGLNADNIMCVITKSFVTADILDNIDSIEEITC